MGRSSTEVLQTRTTLRAEMAAGDLGDARLNARRDQVVHALEQTPDKGFPEACGTAADTEGLYRFLRNRRLTAARVVAPHVAATRARCAAVGEVLVIHDTTELAFPCEQPRRGLTPLGAHRQGFWCHTALAVSADGLRAPLGVLALTPYTRPAPPPPKRPWRERFADPQKESRRWATGVATVGAALAPTVSPIHVMDREGDSYELFAALHAAQARWIIRVHYDRPVGPPAAGQRLSTLRATLPVRYTDTVVVAPRRADDRVQRLAAPARDGRTATVHFAAAPVTLARPRDHRATSLPATIPAHVVFGWEVDPPAGATPVEWWVLTTEPIATEADIRRVVDAYRTRWLIEEFFKALKTGCAYEKRQLESLDTLLIALARLTPIAWQLLVLRHLARACPEAPATVALTRRQVAVLRATRGGRHLPPTPTARDALRAVAQLGGHLRQNGEPGWLCLTRGLQILRHMERGWIAGKASRTDQ